MRPMIASLILRVQGQITEGMDVNRPYEMEKKCQK